MGLQSALCVATRPIDQVTGVQTVKANREHGAANLRIAQTAVRKSRRLMRATSLLVTTATTSSAGHATNGLMTSQVFTMRNGIGLRNVQVEDLTRLQA